MQNLLQKEANNFTTRKINDPKISHKSDLCAEIFRDETFKEGYNSDFSQQLHLVNLA